MKVLVCGSSAFRDQIAVFRELDKLHADQAITLVINGGARGADYFSSQWAKERNVALKVFKADWKQFGDRAVFRLNGDMLTEARPELILAFPGGDVTADLIMRADHAGITVVKV
ncbi:MAG: DUF2493 domain-containing protein [Alphaproteobacteria bacterium]